MFFVVYFYNSNCIFQTNHVDEFERVVYKKLDDVNGFTSIIATAYPKKRSLMMSCNLFL